MSLHLICELPSSLILFHNETKLCRNGKVFVSVNSSISKKLSSFAMIISTVINLTISNVKVHIKRIFIFFTKKIDLGETIRKTCCIFAIQKIFSEIFDFINPPILKSGPGLGPNKARDVKLGTEVILLVSICYKSTIVWFQHMSTNMSVKMPSLCVVFWVF